MKIIIMLVLLMLNGCAPRYEITNLQLSVYGEHCRPIASESCPNGECDKYALGERFRALNANNMTATNNDLGNADSVIYFHCGPEEQAYMVKSSKVSIVKNTINQSATDADLKQSTAECEYEAHKATINTSSPTPTRAYIPTNNYYVNHAQLDAIQNDDIKNSYHELELSTEKQELTRECLKVRGFIFSKSNDKKDIAMFYEQCPEKDGYIDTCFISSKVQ